MKNKLPKKFKEKWLKALRSGEYKQSTGFLTEQYEGESNYCCLGVACKVAHMKDSDMKFGDTVGINSIHKKRLPSLLTHSGKVIDKLISMNDDEGRTFKQIANYIEKHL